MYSYVYMCVCVYIYIYTYRSHLEIAQTPLNHHC